MGRAAALHRIEEIAEGRTRGLAPDLVYAEVVNALRGYVRVSEITPVEASKLLAYVLDLPLESTPCAHLAADALDATIGRGVSSYDAMYLALAEATGAVLVTADRRLAAAATHAELLDD